VKPDKSPGVAETGTSGGEDMETGCWNLEQRAGGRDVRLKLTLVLEGDHDQIAEVDFPWFGGMASNGFENDPRGEVLTRNVPARRITLADGSDALVTTVFDLMCANYSLDRGLGGDHVATSYDDDVPFTPAWAERITGVRRD